MGLLSDLANAFSAPGANKAARAGLDGTCDTLTPTPELKASASVMPFEVCGIAAVRRQHAAAFLSVSSEMSSGGSSGSNAGVSWSHGDVRLPGQRTSFKPKWTGPELGPPKARLMFVSPDIYSTNIGEWDKKFMSNPFVGTGPGQIAAMHPKMRFKELQKQVHVHLEDTTNGRTFWDANYSLALVPGMGSSWLSETARPIPENPGTMPVMQKMFIPRSDPGPHLFDLSVSTQSNWYDDQNDTPWGENEGFDNNGGHNAHIGVEIYRLPKLKDGKEIIKSGKKGSWAPHHDSNMERIINREEDIFEDETTGNPNRLYYGWIVDKPARTKNNYEYMFKPDYPRLVHPYTYEDKEGQPEGKGSAKPKATPTAATK